MLKRKYMSDRGADRSGAPLTGSARELVTHLDRAMRQMFLAGDEPQPTAESFSRSEIAVVDTLGAEGSMAMGELAGRVRMPLSTATRVVDRLVARKIVQRERPEDNRRVVRVALAPPGDAFYQAALSSRIAGAQRMLQRLTEGEQRELVRLFRKIADSIAEEPQG
jgi:DNA-binding MarR family transcriptional regulator